MKSWKTTIGGIISQLPILWVQFMLLLDGDAATNPNWAIVMGSLALIFALFKARDNNVTSKAAGAK